MEIMKYLDEVLRKSSKAYTPNILDEIESDEDDDELYTVDAHYERFNPDTERFERVK